MNYLIVGIGGAFGSVARYTLSLWFNPTAGSLAFPKGTFIANIVGCMLIGAFTYWASMEGRLSMEWKLLLLTGFCGGFTTFSTFSMEGITFLKNELIGLYLLYTVTSIIGGLFAAYFGYNLVQYALKS